MNSPKPLPTLPHFMCTRMRMTSPCWWLVGAMFAMVWGLCYLHSLCFQFTDPRLCMKICFVLFFTACLRESVAMCYLWTNCSGQPDLSKDQEWLVHQKESDNFWISFRGQSYASLDHYLYYSRSHDDNESSIPSRLVEVGPSNWLKQSDIICCSKSPGNF